MKNPNHWIVPAPGSLFPLAQLVVDVEFAPLRLAVNASQLAVAENNRRGTFHGIPSILD